MFKDLWRVIDAHSIYRQLQTVNIKIFWLRICPKVWKTYVWTCHNYSSFVIVNDGQCAPGPIKIRSLSEKLFEEENKHEAAWNVAFSALKTLKSRDIPTLTLKGKISRAPLLFPLRLHYHFLSKINLGPKTLTWILSKKVKKLQLENMPVRQGMSLCDLHVKYHYYSINTFRDVDLNSCEVALLWHPYFPRYEPEPKI